jgi:hypothetical protein
VVEDGYFLYKWIKKRSKDDTVILYELTSTCHFKEISIFSNGHHLGRRTRLTYIILKVDRPKKHPSPIWFHGILNWFHLQLSILDVQVIKI